MKAAVSQFRAALREVPGNADYAYRATRAILMDRDSRPADVRAALDETVAIDPTLVKAHLTRAEFERRQPQPDAAAMRASFDRAVELNPADTDVRLRYGAALEQLGLRKEAAEQYRIALEYNDKLPIEEPERIPPAKVEEIRKKIAELS